MAINAEEARGVHALLAGRHHPLAKVVEETRHARKRGAVTWNIPVTPDTVHRIEGLHRLATDEGAAVQFIPRDLSERDRAFFDDYAANRLKRRPVRIAGRTPEEFAAAFRETADALLRALWPRTAQPPLPDRLHEVVIIGAYGGDHVGDAAILGGVLLTLYRRYGVRSASVMSYRPEHTRRLVCGLNVPVRVTVETFEARRVDALLKGADALVLGGGPIDDLPRVLAKQLAAVYSARALGKPFLIERVGIGGFRSKLSYRAARLMIAQAQIVSVRSSGSRQHRLLDGIDVSVGQDPAFDYLAGRTTLDRLSERDRRAVDNLLDGTSDRTLIGVNLRPAIRTATPSETLQPAENRFIEAFADGLARFAQKTAQSVTYVFFPMNAIQFGKSDLTSAYHLQQRLRGRVDLRVLEADPDIDGILYLLKHLHAAIAMRLHATIYAVSQNVPVLGIDYFPEGRGKLLELFADLDRTDDVIRMDRFDPNWLAERLQCKLRHVSTGIEKSVNA